MVIPILLKYWRQIAALLVVLSIFYAGYHVRGAFDKIEADRLLAEQMEASKVAQDKLNEKAAKVESDLEAARTKYSDLQKRWSKINGKAHTSCKLSDDVASLLKDATSTADTSR